MIHGARIKQVRELRQWTQLDLATRLGVTQSFVAQVESAWAKPPADFMTSLVFQSGFPLSFFEAPPGTDFPLGSLLFRAHADLPEAERKAIQRHSQMAYEVVRRMVSNKAVQEVAVRVPRCQKEPERAAVLTRSEFGLSNDEPVKHVIFTMESAGVLVVALPREFSGIDAFSAWASTNDESQRRPIVVLSAGRPADRVRMSAAHELGHLVMHQPVSATPSEMEHEAKLFAAAFLLPSDPMRDELVAPFTLDTFVKLKERWGVSIQALIVRAAGLGIITQRKYRTLFQQLSAKGWRIHEPLSTKIAMEKPRAVRQIAELLYGRRIDYGKVAAEIQYPESFVKDLIEAHAGKDQRSEFAHAHGESPTKGGGPKTLRFSGKDKR